MVPTGTTSSSLPTTPPGSLGDVAPDLGERDCCKDIVPGPVTAHAVLTWEPVCQGEERAQLSPRVPFPPSIPSRDTPELAAAPPPPVGVKTLQAQSVFYGSIRCCEYLSLLFASWGC